jgi:choline-sulfatase
VYLSDHGLCIGHHGRAEKHCGYDPAVRVPLIFRYPRRLSPRVAKSMVESVDVPATILDLLGVDPLKLQNGQSLRPNLEGREAHREFVFSEYLENEEAYLRTARWKFMYCTGKRHRQDGYETGNPTPGRYVRLFDLDRDPDEYFNVALKNAAVVTDFQQKMLGRFRETHPEAGQEPARLSTEEALDWYLRPRDA